MSAYGADPQSLKKLAVQLGRGADQIEHLATSLTSTLTSVPWKGSDAETFRSHWQTTSTSSIRSAVQQVRKAADDLNRNAEEQLRTSAADGGGAGGSGGGSGSGEGGKGGEHEDPLSKVFDVLKEGNKLKGAGKEVLEALKAAGKGAAWKDFIHGGSMADLEKALGEGTMKELDAVAHEFGAGSMEALRAQLGAEAAAGSKGALGIFGEAGNPLRALEHASGLGRAMEIGGRVAGVVALPLDAYTAFNSHAALGDRITSGISGLGTLATMAPTVAGVLGGGALFEAGGALALVPGVGEVAIAGVAAYEVGHFAYEHREQIEHGLEAAGHGISVAASATEHALGSAASATGHALSGAADKVGSVISDLNPF